MNQNESDEMAKHFRSIVKDDYDDPVSSRPRENPKVFEILVESSYPYNVIDPVKVGMFAEKVQSEWIGIDSHRGKDEFRPIHNVLIFRKFI